MIFFTGLLIYLGLGFAVWYMLLLLSPSNMKKRICSLRFITLIVFVWFFILSFQLFKLTIKK